MQLSVWVMGIVKRFAVNIAVWIPSEIIRSPLVACVCFPAGTNCPVLQRTQPALGEAVSLVFVCGLCSFFVYKQNLITVKNNIFPVTAYLSQQSWT